MPSGSAVGEKAAAGATAPRSSRRRLEQRGAGGVETSSSSAMDSDTQTAALRRANSRQIRSSSSDAATSTDVEAPPRPVSPRRISDPICQHSDSQVYMDDGCGTSVPPSVAPSSARAPQRPIVTTALMHSEPLITVPVATGSESLPLSTTVRSPCLPGELDSDTGNESGHYSWRPPTSTPTSRREHGAELRHWQRSGTSSSLGSLHHQRLILSAAPLSAPLTAPAPRPLPGQADPCSCRGVVPGHLLYRRPAACRSETASPVIDNDDDDDWTSSSGRDRQVHTSWQVRRHLKAISERSQSTDTIYV